MNDMEIFGIITIISGCLLCGLAFYETFRYGAISQRILFPALIFLVMVIISLSKAHREIQNIQSNLTKQLQENK